MVRIGIIGIGFMGFTHFEGAKKVKGGKVAAIATRNPKKRAGDWTMIQGNFGPRGGKVDLSKIDAYSDYRELLDDPNIDLVDVCVPTDQHEHVVHDAIEAGKATLVEKPIAVDLKAADRMVRAAEKAGTLLMVGQVLPFFPEFRFAAECVADGRYGKLRAAHFRRIIAPPDWSDAMSDFRKLGGWGIDLHIHDNHFISHVCGVPAKVFSRGILQEDLVNHVHTQYLFDDPELTVSCSSGGIAASGMPFGHGFEMFFENATLRFDFDTVGKEPSVNRPLTVYTNDGKAKTPRLKGGTEWCAAFTAELQAAVEAVKTGEEPRVLSGALARDALKLCYAEGKSIASGRAVPVQGKS